MTDREKGYLGEEAAAEYLLRLGYEILERNYTVRGGEIDIIAKDGKTLVFAEVKMRKGTQSGAAEAVDSTKLSRIIRSAQRYIFEKSDAADGLAMRFDCIEVYVQAKLGACETEIRHIKNIDVT